MAVKGETERSIIDEKCVRKYERPLPAPIRVLNEYRALIDLSNDSKTFREFKPSCDKKMTWTGLLCPDKEPFNEKAWRIEIEVPRNYPQSPPKLKFVTPIHHPNVAVDSGEIKLEIVETKEWKESVTLIDVLNALLDLINNPNAENEKLVLNKDAAKQYKGDNKDFNKKAQEFASKKGLARPPDPPETGRKKKNAK